MVRNLLSLSSCVVDATALVNKRDEIYGFVIPSESSSVGFSMPRVNSRMCKCSVLDALLSLFLPEKIIFLR